MNVTSNDDKLIIEVSGTKYVLNFNKVLNRSTTKLGRIAEKIKQNGSDLDAEVTFDRPAIAFEAIQAYYQTGILHMPTNICPIAFKQELEFWEIEPCELTGCCLFRYISALDEFETTTKFQETMKRDLRTFKYKECEGSVWLEIKQKMWRVVENEEKTVLSKCYLMAAVFFVLLSIITLAFSTLPSFRTELNTCQKLEIFEEENTMYHQIRENIQSLNCSENLTSQWESLMYENEHENKTISEDEYASLKPEVEKIDKTTYTKVHSYFPYFNYVIDAFFTIELFIRLLSCPNLRRYFLSSLNVIDILVLFAAYTAYFVDSLKLKYRYDKKGLEILHYFDMLRVLRILRVVQNLAAIRVLRFTLKTNKRDLYVLGLYLFVGVVLFANFVYFAEETKNISSIPDAWWWSVITMTTVGYGDVVPKSPTGKIIGMFCALSGVLLLGLVVPMFVNTFLSLYKVAQLNERIMKTESKRKVKTRNKRTICAKPNVVSSSA